MYLTEDELRIIYENLKFSLEQLTDDFTDEQWLEYYKRDITLLNKISDIL
jgi:hypothetical protein